jgi:hypothetical protein
LEEKEANKISLDGALDSSFVIALEIFKLGMCQKSTLLHLMSIKIFEKKAESQD